MKISIEIDDKKLARTLRVAGWTAVVGIAVTAGVAAAGPVSQLFTFSPGQLISSAQVNQNFETLRVAINDNDARIGNLGALQTASRGSLVDAVNETLSASRSPLFALLGGRSGGQTLYGGADAGEELILDSTASAAKGNIVLAPQGGRVGIGGEPGNTLSVSGGVTVDARGLGDVGSADNALRFGGDPSGEYISSPRSGAAAHTLQLYTGSQLGLMVGSDGSVFAPKGLQVGGSALDSAPLAGRIHVEGASAELSFADRGATGYVTSPQAGERWSLYASGGAAHLWSGGDKLQVSTAGIVSATGFRGDGSGLSGVAASSENVRVVRGLVSSSGTIISGSGYTVSRLGGGVYRVTFAQPFSDLPAVTVSMVNSVNAAMVVGESGYSTGQVTVKAMDGADHNFTFIAAGGR